MKAFVLSLSMFCFISVNAQLTHPEQKIILYNGEEIIGKKLLYETPLFKPSEFVLDGVSYESSAVEFFQNNHGYFANLGRQHNNRQERYAMRIQKGKLNLFEEIEISVYGGELLQTEENSNGKDPMLASGEVFHYYKKDGETIKKATCKNLKVDLSDNENSMKHLKAYKKYQVLQWGLIGVGTGFIAANIIAQSSTGIKFNPVMAIGLVVGGSSYFLQAPKSDSIWLAADEYNAVNEVVSTH